LSRVDPMPEPSPVGPPIDAEETRLAVGEPKRAAAGLPAVRVSMSRAARQMGPVRAARALLRLNQVAGYDCMRRSRRRRRCSPSRSGR
jgi:hypothetical protein